MAAAAIFSYPQEHSTGQDFGNVRSNCSLSIKVTASEISGILVVHYPTDGNRPDRRAEIINARS
jgi:hypothetical protein